MFPIASAVDYQDDPNDCPNSYQSQTCSGSGLVCGYDSGITYCYDPSAHPTSFGLQSVTSYSASFQGTMLLDCHSYDGSEPHCDNGGAYLCDRDETTFSTEFRQTNCTGWNGAFDIGDCRSGYYNCFGDLTCEATSTSDCNASTIPHTRYTVSTCNTNITEIPIGQSTCGCDTGYFTCDGGIQDPDGCEIQTGSTCGSGTGTVVANQCFSVDAGNCTRISDYVDCDDDDSDGNNLTCNAGNGCEINPQTTNFPTGDNNHYEDCVNCGCDTGYLDCDAGGCGATNGCEVQDGGSCSVGALSGTYDGCTCVVPKAYFQTGTLIEYFSNISQQGMLWFKNYWSDGNLIVANNSYDAQFIVDNETNIITNGSLTIRGNTISNGTDTFTLEDLNRTGGSGDGSTYNATYDAYVIANYTNKSNFWDDMNTFNSTQMENSDGLLNIMVSWLTSLFYTKDEVNNTIAVEGERLGFNSTYNATYDSYKTNVSYGDIFVNTTGDVMTGNLNLTYNLSIGNVILFYYNGSDLIIE